VHEPVTLPVHEPVNKPVDGLSAGPVGVTGGGLVAAAQ
jgi:hypothetical protein